MYSVSAVAAVKLVTMYLSQTNLEVDTSKVYTIQGQEVYLTVPIKGTTTQIVTKSGFDKYGRDVQMYAMSYKYKALLKEVV